ncbi:MAG TPA: ClpXP protease specificity-enhancing factor SspB [Hyphomicrobiaceae bacterium]|nr:ClpXP protease specificity-enhancing factor SspB [Hyphomicrobiaceae bacterium]
MTAEQEIDYEALVQGAMRGIVRTLLTRVAKSGLPGEHHFYIAFNTGAPGVSMSPRLKAKYPEEMTVVLQHRFWDLTVSDERFDVKLTFDGVPERLVVPFAAIKVFFDPSVPYGLQFEEAEGTGGTRQLGAARGEAAEAATKEPAAGRNGSAARPEKKPRAARKSQADKAETGTEAGAPKKPAKIPSALPKPEERAQPATQSKVVSIDAFRKK